MRPNWHKRRKTLGPEAALLVATLNEWNRPVFRLEHVRKILRLSSPSARSFARKLVDRGVATRLKPGLFVLVPFEIGSETEYMGNPLVVAREIVHGRDYYLSHATAMDIHGMITQPQLVVYLSTTSRHRTLTAMSVEFRFVHSRPKHFFGLTDHWVTKQEKVRVSDLERTVLDGLKQPQHAGGISEVAKGLWIRRQDVDTARIVRYAERLGIGAVIRRLGFLLETYEMGTKAERERLHRTLTPTYARLDPILPAEGRYLHRWRLQLNVEPEEILGLVGT